METSSNERIKNWDRDKDTQVNTLKEAISQENKEGVNTGDCMDTERG